MPLELEVRTCWNVPLTKGVAIETLGALAAKGAAGAANSERPATLAAATLSALSEGELVASPPERSAFLEAGRARQGLLLRCGICWSASGCGLAGESPDGAAFAVRLLTLYWMCRANAGPGAAQLKPQFVASWPVIPFEIGSSIGMSPTAS